MTRYIFTLVGALLLTGAIASQNTYGGRCGLAKESCPMDMFCIPDDPNCKGHCEGYCDFRNKYRSCGGNTPTPQLCNKNERCVDDPRRPESCGMACDAPGICLPKKLKTCGGFAGFRCPDAKYCYDDPKSVCSSTKGAADCLGICL